MKLTTKFNEWTLRRVLEYFAFIELIEFAKNTPYHVFNWKAAIETLDARPRFEQFGDEEWTDFRLRLISSNIAVPVHTLVKDWPEVCSAAKFSSDAQNVVDHALESVFVLHREASEEVLADVPPPNVVIYFVEALR